MLDDMGRDLLGMWNVNNTFIEFSRLHPKRGGDLLPPPAPRTRITICLAGLQSSARGFRPCPGVNPRFV